MRLNAALLVILLPWSNCSLTERPSCALQDLAVSAATGNRVAQYNLAVEFYTGDLVPQDYAKAAILWRQAADQGMATAKSNLGFLTYNGYGVRADPAAAVKLWLEAAAQGESEANYHLGVAAQEGKGTKRSVVEAYARFRAAEMMGGTVKDRVAANVTTNARDEIENLVSVMSPGERSSAEGLARQYASARAEPDSALQALSDKPKP